MRNILRLVLVTVVSSSLMSASCSRKMEPLPQKLCEGVMCTAMFTMITVSIADSNGQPVALDNYYTLRPRTGEKITSQQTLGNGSYVVLDDSYQKNLVNQSEDFRFVGIKNGLRVVDEPYRLSADCCHVKKENGRATVVAK